MLNLYEILKENRFIINESQESKSQAKAKKLCIKNGMSDEEAEDFVRNKLRSDITNLRHKDTAKFTLGCARLFFNNELKDAKSISLINNIVELIAKKHIDDFDQNLNDLSLDELHEEFSQEMEDIENKNIEDVNSKTYSNNGYKIVPINSFAESQKYFKYVYKKSPWCLTHMPNMWRSYTKDGVNQVYFCLKDGFEDMTPPEETGNPKDEYGLSMISVIVDEDGKLEYSTTRWNHANRANGDHDFTVQEISDIVGVNFYEAFKPYDGEERRETGLTREEYYDEVVDNREFFNSFGDIYSFCFSQDLEPYYEDEYYIANQEEYKFGIIAINEYGGDECIENDYNYSVTNSLIENKDDFYFIAKNEYGNLLFVFNEFTQDGNYGTINNIDDYLIIDDENVVVKSTRDDYIHVAKYNEGIIYESEDSVDIETVKKVLGDLGNFLQFNDDNNNYTLINLNNGKVIIEDEAPIDGNIFIANEDGNIVCEGGIYSIDGKLLQGEGRKFKIDSKIARTNLAYVIDNNDKYNLYNLDTKSLVYDLWFKKLNFFDNSNEKIISIVDINNGENIAINIKGETFILFRESYTFVMPSYVENKLFFRIKNNSNLLNVANENGEFLFKDWKENVLYVNGDNNREWAYCENVNGKTVYMMFDVINAKETSGYFVGFRQLDRTTYHRNEIILGNLEDGRVALLYRENGYKLNEDLVFNSIKQLARIPHLYIVSNGNEKNIINLSNKNFVLNKNYNEIEFIGYDEDSNRIEYGIVCGYNGNVTDLYAYDEDLYFYDILKGITNFRLCTNSSAVNKLSQIGIGLPYAYFVYGNNNMYLSKGLSIVNSDTGNTMKLLDKNLASKIEQNVNANSMAESIKKEFFKKYNLIEKTIRKNQMI